MPDCKCFSYDLENSLKIPILKIDVLKTNRRKYVIEIKFSYRELGVEKVKTHPKENLTLGLCSLNNGCMGIGMPSFRISFINLCRTSLASRTASSSSSCNKTPGDSVL